MTYSLLSKYRSELMGVAMLWVMFFHAFDLNMGHPLLEWFRAAGFGGVDIFILLSSMGLAMSLSRREQDYSSFMARRAGRILPAYYIVMLPYTLFLILVQGKAWSALLFHSRADQALPCSSFWFRARPGLLCCGTALCSTTGCAPPALSTGTSPGL